MKHGILFALCIALTTFACGTDSDDEEVTMEWSAAPSTEVTAGQPFQAAWIVSGGVEIPHTNLHSCPASDPACKAPSDGGTRVDGEVLTGQPGPDPFNQAYILPPGQWITQAHARVVESEGADPVNHFLPIPDAAVITSTGVMITVEPEDAPAAGDITFTFAAGGADGATVANAAVSATDGTDTVDGTATDNGDGTWSATVPIAAAGDWTFTATADVNGTNYTHSVDRAVQ